MRGNYFYVFLVNCSTIIQNDWVVSVALMAQLALSQLVLPVQVLASMVSVDAPVSAEKGVLVCLSPVPDRVAKLLIKPQLAPLWVPIVLHRLDFATIRPAYRVPLGCLLHL